MRPLPCPPEPPAAATAAVLRVVLVEDDPLVQQLLTMVWDDYALDLVACNRVPQAVDALRAAPADLIVTDLMLPGESGLELLERLAAEPALRAQARIAVFSAGIDIVVQGHLQAHDVWRVLRKPLPIADLQHCVEDAGARPRMATAAAPLHAGDRPPAAPPASAPPLGTEELAAVQTHFGGNVALFTAFRDAARLQFGHDRDAGNAALARGDAPALRHLAHALKSVLRSLGHASFSHLAAELEASAASADWRAMRPQWSALSGALASLAHDG